MTALVASKSSYVHARINPHIKQKASDILEQLGLSISDFITLSLNEVILNKTVRFELSLLKNDSPENYTKIKDAVHLKKLLKMNEKEERDFWMKAQNFSANFWKDPSNDAYESML